MKIEFTSSSMLFAGCPIIIKCNPDNYQLSTNELIHGLKIEVFYNGDNIFLASVTPPCTVELSEVLRSAVEPYPEIMPKGVLSPVRRLSECRLFICLENFEEETEYTVLPGSISRSDFKRLAKQNSDIFTTRFLNPHCNRFLTSRTSGRIISIKETELYPLYFINDKWDCLFEVYDLLSGNSYREAISTKGVYAFDVTNVRKRFFSKYGVISNVFDIKFDGIYSCRIVIEHAETAKERYRLKFRNSLGVFEILDLTGSMSVNVKPDMEDDSIFNRYDPVYLDYTQQRERKELSRSFKIAMLSGDTGQHCYPHGYDSFGRSLSHGLFPESDQMYPVTGYRIT